jgi:hypothetical protein
MLAFLLRWIPEAGKSRAQQLYEHAHAYGTPADRAREGLRKAVREILVACLLSFFGFYALDSYQHRAYPSGDSMTLAIVLCIPTALVLWIVYRIVRFALAR